MDNRVKTNGRNHLGPFITMVFLFFIVGFLTTANTQFQGPLKEAFLSKAGGLKNTIATLITFSWFLAYPIAGGIGSKWVAKHGYKGTRAEVCIGANINMYAIEMEFYSPALLATLYWGGMLVVTTSTATVLILLAIILNNLWLLAAVGLFHSIMWGAIFTLSVNKLGKYTNAPSGVFMIGVIGGAVFPLLQGLIADLSGGWRLSWLMVIACELYMLYYALWGSKVLKTAE